VSENRVYEIAILGKVTWDLHSLSNEGTVGNVTEPRTVVLADGTKTDGVSGEMLKHVHAVKMWELESNKNKLCEACSQLKPERADGVKVVRKQSKPEDAVKEAINCILCDIHGFLVQKPTVSRSSLVEFGWAVGVPNKMQRDIHVHARHSVHEAYLPIDEERNTGDWGGNTCSDSACTTAESDSKLYRIKRKWYCEEHLPVRTPQMVYHRPTRSGTYAIISLFQPWRIGLNNVSLDYQMDENERQYRYQLALKAYQAMFMRTDGAMTTTRLPHTQSFEGAIVVSRVNFPAPVISPLKEDYINELEKIVSGSDGVEVRKFNSISEFVDEINILAEEGVYTIT